MEIYLERIRDLLARTFIQEPDGVLLAHENTVQPRMTTYKYTKRSPAVYTSRTSPTTTSVVLVRSTKSCDKVVPRE